MGGEPEARQDTQVLAPQTRLFCLCLFNQLQWANVPSELPKLLWDHTGKWCCSLVCRASCWCDCIRGSHVWLCSQHSAPYPPSLICMLSSGTRFFLAEFVLVLAPLIHFLLYTWASPLLRPGTPTCHTATGAMHEGSRKWQSRQSMSSA